MVTFTQFLTMIITITFSLLDGFQVTDLYIIVLETSGFIIWIYYMGITR